ncbi:uncharacterized protein LOC131010891 [Salvia miltiorrhiza]|uniref:uncharacterized protein LOC131010891 n=1 Tax=Salvia miltiorrhiza TaxID=226208 RepID=UPI0025AC617D|nr:uncharacterized protein LOC131010891 [Salvia miltiorrhiza]
MVFKWLWRYLTGGEALWARVVKSIYGEVSWGIEGECRLENRGGGKGWWARLIAKSGEKDEKWFSSNISRRVGDGMRISFWDEVWVGCKPLKFVFPRLFNLCGNKRGCVGEMGFWENGNWIWEIGWRRELRDRERGMWEELRTFFSHITPCAGKEDDWQWKPGKDAAFSTKTGYDTIAASKNGQLTKRVATQLKFGRLRLPIRRNVAIGPEERWCNSCVMQEETAEHIFLNCPKVEMVWDGIFQWLDIKTAKPKGITQHFKSFVFGARRKKGRKLLLALWVGIVWLIWKYRNESRFEGRV